MADKKPVFNVLQDLGTEEGAPIHVGAEGSTIVGKNAVPSLGAKDPSDQFAYLKVNADGRLLIQNDDGDFACLDAYAKIAGNAALTLVSEITLQNSKEYDKIGYIVSCFRDSEFIIEHVDDEGGVGTITELGSILVGPGQFTDSEVLDCIKFTSGAVGVQKLRLRAKNQSSTSDLRGTISTREKQ